MSYPDLYYGPSDHPGIWSVFIDHHHRCDDEQLLEVMEDVLESGGRVYRCKGPDVGPDRREILFEQKTASLEKSDGRPGGPVP